MADDDAPAEDAGAVAAVVEDVVAEELESPDDEHPAVTNNPAMATAPVSTMRRLISWSP